MTRRISLAAWVAACLVLAVAPLDADAQAPAKKAPQKKEADPTARAREHFRKGALLYKQARYSDAIAEFEAAYRVRPHGVIWFNIAQSHEKLGDIGQALRAYHEYLRHTPDAEDKDTVEMAMRNLEARLGEQGLQQLRVYSRPEGAAVFINGQRRGATPFSAELPLGRYKVAVEVRGQLPREREVELTAKTSAVLDFSLDQATQSPPPVVVRESGPDQGSLPRHPPSPGEVSREAVTAAPAAAVAPVPRAEAQPGSSPARLWTWVAAGAAVAVAGGGGYFGVSARNAETELRTRPHLRPEVTDLRDGAVRDANTANVLYGVAGVVGAASVALFFVEGKF